jgi:hypothetical protein
MRNIRIILCRIILCLTACFACAFLSGCGGSSGSSTANNVITTTGANVAPISVNGGPQGTYADAAFISVTVCVPGTSTCQTVDDVLVDTGSSGLRILSSALTAISLPQQSTSAGNPTFECYGFVSSFTWGAVQDADVQIGGEKASSVPIQVIGESTPPPDKCSSAYITPSDTLDTLGANGLLGVGFLARDCGIPSGAPCPADAVFYFDCPSATTCSEIAVTSAQQVANPVSLFPTDNNGVIVELPSVPGGEAVSVSGSLVFGIGTQSNNGLGGATVYAADEYLNFTTTYNGTAYSESFIDSGSDGYFFPDTDSALPPCPGEPAGLAFYCPSATQNLSAVNQGAGGSATGTINFSVANANNLPESDFALSDLGGEFDGEFDWGLPFFFGRNVYVAIDGASTTGGGTGPYWAY